MTKDELGSHFFYSIFLASICADELMFVTLTSLEKDHWTITKWPFMPFMSGINLAHFDLSPQLGNYLFVCSGCCCADALI